MRGLKEKRKGEEKKRGGRERRVRKGGEAV